MRAEDSQNAIACVNAIVTVAVVNPFPLSQSIRTAGKRVVTIALSVAVPFGMVGIGPAGAAPAGLTVTVDASKPGFQIPADFVGMSFEANQMHRTWTDPNRGNVAALLANLGPGNLRFSANQVDNTAWMPDPSKPTPSWAKDGQRVEPADLSRVGDLARAIGWSVDLGVNFGHFDPAAAANQAAAAQARIGSSLRSIQIGNEPNAYALNIASGDRKIYNPRSYVHDSKVYRNAIRAQAPGVRIEGPDTIGASIGVAAVDPGMWPTIVQPWLDAYTAAFASESRFLTQHYYPYVNVTRVGVPAGVADPVGALPTIDRLLDPATRAKQDKFLRTFASTAHKAGLKAHLTETNSVAKEGREGVTNSFGAALWTVDYLMTAARAGVAGFNLHNQVDDCQSYPLFCFPNAAAKQSDMAIVNPNYYATLMVSKMAGGRVLPTTTGRAGVIAHAVRMSDGQVKVIVTNLDKNFRAKVTVKVVGVDSSSASVQQLTAPSIYATTGTRFAGSTVTPQGSFAVQPGTPIAKGVNGYPLTFGKPGAALMTVG